MLKHLVESLTKAIERHNADLAKWKKSLDVTPVHAMIWSKGTFQIVAELSVYKDVLELIERLRPDGKTDDEVEVMLKDHLTQRTLSLAGSVASSSSFTSNAMEEYIRAATAKVARFNGFLL